MASCFLQKLIRNQKPLISNLNKGILSLSSPTHLVDPSFSLIPLFNTIPKPSPNPNPNPQSSVFYPSFAFESFLNPISEMGYIVPQEENGDTEIGIWADSVKKKRKKKMNKHKLKKLRKRLRRKT